MGGSIKTLPGCPLLASPSLPLQPSSLTQAAVSGQTACGHAAPSLHACGGSPVPFLVSVFAKNFRVNAVMKTSVLLSWEVPDSYKSSVPFKVRPASPGRGDAPVVRGAALRSAASPAPAAQGLLRAVGCRRAEHGHAGAHLGTLSVAEVSMCTALAQRRGPCHLSPSFPRAEL